MDAFYQILKRIVLYVFCIITMFPAYFNYVTKQPSYDIGKIQDNSVITVVSANARGFDQDDKGDTHWFVRAPLFVKTLEKAKPDIIGMQEVSKVQFPYLQRSLRGYGSETLYVDNGAFGGSNPLFYNKSKFDLVEKGSFWLSETPEKMSISWGAACFRTCSFVILEQKSDHTRFAVFNTHLDHISLEARVNGIKLVAERMQKYSNMPCIMMGDFNAGAEYGSTYNTATTYFKDAKFCTEDSDDGITWHGWDFPDNSEIDDFFMSSKTGIDVKQYRILRDSYDGVYPSDHYPIMMKMTLTKTDDEINPALPEIVPDDPVILP